MLHEILDLAQQHGFPASHVLFCPTHYNGGAVHGIGPVTETYLDTFDRDPRLHEVQFTFTYVTEAQIAERKRRFPHLRYALFWNGPRWLAYDHRASPAPGQPPHSQYGRSAMYFPIYYGWHSAAYDPKTGWLINTGDDVRRNFHEVIPRETAQTTLLGNIANYTDSIFCGPVEYALWGHYCWNPPAHDTRQSEVAIGDSLFGERNGRIMAQLNRVLLDLVRLFFESVPLTDDDRAGIPERLAMARAWQQQLAAGYERYRSEVAVDAVSAWQDFYVRLGLERIQKTIGDMEAWARYRGVTSSNLRPLGSAGIDGRDADQRPLRRPRGADAGRRHR